MLVSHDDDDYEKDDDDGLPKNQVKRRISSHGRTANELPNAHVVAFLLIILTKAGLFLVVYRLVFFWQESIFRILLCSVRGIVAQCTCGR